MRIRDYGLRIEEKVESESNPQSEIRIPQSLGTPALPVETLLLTGGWSRLPTFFLSRISEWPRLAKHLFSARRIKVLYAFSSRRGPPPEQTSPWFETQPEFAIHEKNCRLFTSTLCVRALRSVVECANATAPSGKLRAFIPRAANVGAGFVTARSGSERQQ